jgi:Na+/H+-dicarboxylate symporter
MASPSDPQLANRILRGLVFGLIAGAATIGLGKFAPGILTGAQSVATHVLEPIGQVFLRLLFFVIIPLVFASLASGVLQLGRSRSAWG